LIKYVVTENAISAVQKAVAAIGNPALSRDNPLERHLRNVLCARIHTPQADAALGLSGRLSLGIV
jgi:alkylation response protein AidB-like acyl-CoA dehydrogenase